MKTIVLDGAEMLTRAALHDYLTARLALPEYYGRNLDALADCLSEVSRPTLLVLYRAEAMTAALGDYGRTLADVLREAAEENPKLTFAVDGEDFLQI